MERILKNCYCQVNILFHNTWNEVFGASRFPHTIGLVRNEGSFLAPLPPESDCGGPWKSRNRELRLRPVSL